ncbi:hypothetical protein VTK56DRAFT_6565 [Thermocarpiscus australiensis]
MLVKHLVPALAAIGSAAAQAGTCTVSTTTVNSQAEATKLASCRTVDGTVVVGPEAAGNIDISGPREITGDLKILNNGVLETFQSSSLATIGGAFTMNNVTKLASLSLAKLTSVKTLAWQSLTNLNSLNLGPLTKADEVTVSDTFLNTLDGIDLTTVKKFDINNNRRLTKFSTQLGSLSDNLNIQANGLSLEIDLPKLIWIANMTIANVTKFSAPSLRVVNGSARFDSNYFESFNAPNLTETQSGDISFVGNGKLANMTFPKLTSIGGGLLIANNTELLKVDGFPELEQVGGAIKLRGSFDEIKFPKLDIVKGAFDASSTKNISGSCHELQQLAPQSQGGEGKVAGTFACTSNNDHANEDTGTNTSSSGTTDSGDDNGDDNGAAGLALNTALFGLVLIAGLASAL